MESGIDQQMQIAILASMSAALGEKTILQQVFYHFPIRFKTYNAQVLNLGEDVFNKTGYLINLQWKEKYQSFIYQSNLQYQPWWKYNSTNNHHQ